MANFPIPTREDVSAPNQTIFDTLTKQLGFVPNLYATYAHSDNALGNYLALSGAKTSLSTKEKEVVNLAVSQANECAYCLAAHTAIGKMNGFSEEQILELREGRASFDAKLDALARFARQTTLRRGKPSQDIIDALLAAGYNRENLVDAVVLIGEKTISNYLHGVTQVDIDFPAAVELEGVTA
ncbi:alkylhydroperoxidase [Lewinellaceae bacterium SD302]|nr:alkylhydroperoxidase [Lewinellaceae bacterium SD302]